MNDGTISAPFNGCPSGTTAMAINNSSQIRWGECVNTFAISYAINQALTQSGISVDKVHYSWKYIHCFNTPGKFCNNNISDRVNTNTGEIIDDTYWDELVVVIEVTDANGNVVDTKTWTMDKWYNYTSANSHSANEIKQGSTYWQIVEDNIELYNHIDKIGTIYTPNQLGDVRFRFNGYDKGNWDGYYGPIVRDLKAWFTYRANPCNDTALYDPSCPGYSEAYAQYQYDQNCAANALYDVGCPGYATALFNQQCTANPLYNASCPGYAEAYYTQQCTADPLYDSGCDGYAAAYFTQQCTKNPLYDSECDGYAAAYFNQQCTASPLYDKDCPGYFEAQCDANALFDIRCTGYDVAYLNQQCLRNPQYDESCPGYTEPIVNVDPVDDGTGTGDSVVDSVLALPEDIPEVIILPAPAAPAPPPVEIVAPVETEVVTVEVTLEQELEAEIAEIDTIEPEVEVVETTTTEENNTKEKVVENVKNEETKSKPVTSIAEKSSKKSEVKKVTKAEKQKAKRKKMREIIKNKLTALAVTMGKAQELKDQQALQAQIAALINFVPGFNQYGKFAIPGVDFYQPEAIYLNKKVPENQRGLRNGLAQQLLHEKMVDMQYERLQNGTTN